MTAYTPRHSNPIMIPNCSRGSILVSPVILAATVAMIQTPATDRNAASTGTPTKASMTKAITETTGVILVYQGAPVHVNNGRKIALARGTAYPTKKPIPEPRTNPIPNSWTSLTGSPPHPVRIKKGIIITQPTTDPENQELTEALGPRMYPIPTPSGMG